MKMRFLDTLFAVTSLVSCASAFYPYCPPYRTLEDGQCIAPSDSLKATRDEVAGIASFKISQRRPKVVTFHNHKLSLLIYSLRSKSPMMNRCVEVSTG